MDLWHDLIDFSIDKPYFVHVLLHNIGTHVDPRILIERIEAGREIPGLRDSLVQIMHDYQLQVILKRKNMRAKRAKYLKLWIFFRLIENQIFSPFFFPSKILKK